MYRLAPIEPIDYLVIGHVTRDVTPAGYRLGGTVSFSARTALAMGLRVGIVTASEPGLEFPELEGITVASIPSTTSTIFENIQTPNGRVQLLHGRAEPLVLSHIPETWRDTPVVHLGPVAQEVDPNLARSFPNSFVGLTPQGWMRSWDDQGHVSSGEWPESSFVLSRAGAAVLSIEDVHHDERLIEEMVSSIRILVVTEGAGGARLYWNGDLRRFSAPTVTEVDPTGAGDIFATAFFIRLQATRDPWEAARFATRLASVSVTRVGLAGTPTPEDVQACLVEVIS